MAAPAGGERGPGPAQARRDRARPLHQCRRTARKGPGALRDAGVVDGFRGSAGQSSRWSTAGVRTARRGGVSPRRNRAHAWRRARHIEIAAASCADGAAEALGTMNDQWTNRLSEYLDGELDDTERAVLEAHLATCGHCYATLGELRQVVARAQSLADTPPATDLWPDIAREIRRAQAPARRDRPVRRRFSLTVGQLLAASIALVLLSGGSVWLAVQQRSPTTAAEPAVTPQSSTARVASWTRSTDV